LSSTDVRTSIRFRKRMTVSGKTVPSIFTLSIGLESGVKRNILVTEEA
jgi:hypothetical protein